MAFRVFYRQGSFVLADLCGNRDEALAHAGRVQTRRGVWLVRVEDADGRPVRVAHDLAQPWLDEAAVASGADGTSAADVDAAVFANAATRSGASMPSIERCSGAMAAE